MARPGSESEITAELDTGALRGLLELESREPTPTAVIRRDHLRELLAASSQPEIVTLARPVALHTIRRSRVAPRSRHALADREQSEASPLVLYGVIAVLIALFIAVVRL